MIMNAVVPTEEKTAEAAEIGINVEVETVAEFEDVAESEDIAEPKVEEDA